MNREASKIHSTSPHIIHSSRKKVIK
jgi:hypothetical protein